MISFKLHLALDFIAGVIFIIAPFLFGLESTIRAYYLIIGVAIIVVVMCADSDIASTD